MRASSWTQPYVTREPEIALAREDDGDVPRGRVRVLLFLSSYSPLLVMIGARAWPHAPEVTVTLVLLALASVMTLRLVLRIGERQAPQRYEVGAVSQKGGDVAAYVVTYLIPFLDVHFDDLGQMVSLLVLFASIGLVYVRSNLIYVNPVLSALGFHLYEVELRDHLVLALLSRDEALQPKSIWAASLGPHVLVDRST